MVSCVVKVLGSNQKQGLIQLHIAQSLGEMRPIDIGNEMHFKALNAGSVTRSRHAALRRSSRVP